MEPGRLAEGDARKTCPFRPLCYTLQPMLPAHPTPHDSNRTVTIILQGEAIRVPYGTPVGEVLAQHLEPGKLPVLSALVHNRWVDLTFPLCAPAEITPVDYSKREGVLAYRRTACLVLLEAARQLWPGVRVTIGQALGNGYHYQVHGPQPFSPEQLLELQGRMEQIITADMPLSLEQVHLDEAVEIFRKAGQQDKVRLLASHFEPFVTLVRLGAFRDLHHHPVAPRTGVIKTYELVHYPPGLILRFPSRWTPTKIGKFHDSPVLFAAYRETRQWNAILGVEDVGQLNELTASGEAGQLIRVAEGLHEKKIAGIAERISEERARIRLVTIAGPSSSGKTTFAKRLSLQLRVCGMEPVELSTDNFYVNRVDTPKDSQGNYDFESIEAIDLPLFNETLVRLMKGEEVLTPKFNFQRGLRVPKAKWSPMKLSPGQILVVEGIHGLNDRLTADVPVERKFKIYVSALTQLCIDDHNRIFTSDTRFLRRIVRDRRYRGYSAAQTIANWPSVRRGELRNIFPFQDSADVMFNSALIYEQAVLRLYAERFLLEVPRDSPSFVDAYRLLHFVQNFVPMFDETVPRISILREFVGGSAFEY